MGSDRSGCHTTSATESGQCIAHTVDDKRVGNLSFVFLHEPAIGTVSEGTNRACFRSVLHTPSRGLDARRQSGGGNDSACDVSAEPTERAHT